MKESRGETGNKQGITAMYSESVVSNAVVSHKNELIHWIDYSNGPDDLVGAARAMLAVRECWRLLDYAYKWDELWLRISRRSEELGCKKEILDLYEKHC